MEWLLEFLDTFVKNFFCVSFDLLKFSCNLFALCSLGVEINVLTLLHVARLRHGKRSLGSAAVVVELRDQTLTSMSTYFQTVFWWQIIIS